MSVGSVGPLKATSACALELDMLQAISLPVQGGCRVVQGPQRVVRIYVEQAPV